MPEQAGRVPMGLRNESLGKGSSNRKTLEIARGVYIFSTTPYSSLLFCLDSVGNEIDRVLLMLLLSSMWLFLGIVVRCHGATNAVIELWIWFAFVQDSSIHLNHGDEYSYRESQTSVYKAEDQRHKEKDTPRDKERDKEEDTAKGRLRENEDPLLWLREERIREQELERRKWLEVKEKEDAKKEEEERRREEARRREEERQREQAEEERRKEAEQKRRMEQYQQPNLHQDQNHFDDRNNKKNDPEVLRKAQKEEEEERLAKEALLAKLRAIDEGKHDVRLSSSTRKEYNFTEPVNNLHQGLPAHGQRKSNIFGDGDSPTFGSYQPSFVPRDTKMANRRDSKTSSKPAVGNKNEKSDLFAELFGTEPKRASNVLTDARQDSPVLLELGGSTMKAKQYPTQLHREKQAVGPVFRSTAKKIEFSDEEIEEIEELTIKWMLNHQPLPTL